MTRPTDSAGIVHDLDLTAAAKGFVHVGRLATEPDLPSATRIAREIVHNAMLTFWTTACGLDADDEQHRRLAVKMLLAHYEQQTYADIHAP